MNSRHTCPSPAARPATHRALTDYYGIVDLLWNLLWNYALDNILSTKATVLSSPQSRNPLCAQDLLWKETEKLATNLYNEILVDVFSRTHIKNGTDI